MGDVALIDLPHLVSLNKNREYQQEWVLVGKTLIDFALANGLIKPEHHDRLRVIDEQTIVMFSHLTDLGLAFRREGAINRWLNSHDRGRPIESTTILERGLKKVRELGPDHFLDDEWIKEWATPDE